MGLPRSAISSQTAIACDLGTLNTLSTKNMCVTPGTFERAKHFVGDDGVAPASRTARDLETCTEVGGNRSRLQAKRSSARLQCRSVELRVAATKSRAQRGRRVRNAGHHRRRNAGSFEGSRRDAHVLRGQRIQRAEVARESRFAMRSRFGATHALGVLRRRPSRSTRRSCGAMARAGCRASEIGSDSGTQAHRCRQAQETFTLDQIVLRTRCSRELGVYDCHTFVLGALDRDRGGGQRALAFVDELDPAVSCSSFSWKTREKMTVHRARHRDGILSPCSADEAPKRRGCGGSPS